MGMLFPVLLGNSPKGFSQKPLGILFMDLWERKRRLRLTRSRLRWATLSLRLRWVLHNERSLFSIIFWQVP